MSEDAAAYRVLARKYRPASFAGLIGQDLPRAHAEQRDRDGPLWPTPGC